ncbi:MAG: FtsX-like permease family protein [Verrucomicrobiales bacterium]|nr:FtsX-like permease family protein [Verrucomicrobiales bacterium]
MYRLALRILFADRTRYFTLVSGIAFSTLLIVQQASVFCGLMSWTDAILRNSRAEIWVMDTFLEQVQLPRPMREIELTRVRSVEGVKWAVPYFHRVLPVKQADGQYKMVQVIGLDNVSLIGAPRNIVAGNLENIRSPDTVMIDDYAVERISENFIAPNGEKRDVRLGDWIDINGSYFKIGAICDANRPIYGGPYIYMTYKHAQGILSPDSRTLAYMMVATQEGADIPTVVERIKKETGLLALEHEDFSWKTLKWFFANTGIPLAFGNTVVLGLIVGAVITGQTLFSFVTENSRILAALKAMGTSNRVLLNMILLQATSAALVGYGIGVGLASAFGLFVIPLKKPPFILLPHTLIIVFIVIFVIAMVCALLASRKVLVLEPDTVFRT